MSDEIPGKPLAQPIEEYSLIVRERLERVDSAKYEKDLEHFRVLISNPLSIPKEYIDGNWKVMERK